MSDLTRETCAFAADGTCKFDSSACSDCKIDRETSDFHRTHIMGMTWDELKAKQKGGAK